MDHSTKTEWCHNAHIAETMNISIRRVKKLSSRYKNTDSDKIIYPLSIGRSVDSIPGCKEHSAVLAARRKNHVDAMRLHKRIEDGEETPAETFTRKMPQKEQQ